MSKSQEELLEKLLKWTRLMGMQEARNVIPKALEDEDDDREAAAKIAYQLTDGENTTSDIAEYIPFSYRWVSYRQNEWANLGIVSKSEPQAPYEHIISLDAIGVEYPDIQKDEADELTEVSSQDNDNEATEE